MVKHWQHVPLPYGAEERVFFWHELEEREVCDVCMNRFEGALKELNDQIIQSYNMPSLILGNSNLTGVGAQPGGGSTGRIASRKSAFSYGTGSTFGGEYAPEYNYPIANGYGHKEFSMTPKELAAVDKARGHSGTRDKTPQELYDEARERYAASFPMDHVALAEMLSYVSAEVPCDEIPVSEVPRQRRWTWADTRCAVFWICAFLAIFFSIAH